MKDYLKTRERGQAILTMVIVIRVLLITVLQLSSPKLIHPSSPRYAWPHSLSQCRIWYKSVQNSSSALITSAVNTNNRKRRSKSGINEQ